MDAAYLATARRAQAEELAEQLRVKIEKYFPEAPEPARIAELQARRTEIEQLGFSVSFNMSLDVSTLTTVASVTLSPIPHNE